MTIALAVALVAGPVLADQHMSEGQMETQDADAVTEMGGMEGQPGTQSGDATETAQMGGTDGQMQARADMSGTMGDTAMQNVIRSSNIEGGSVYTVVTEIEDDEWFGTDYYTEIDAEWEQVGAVTDLAISRDGQLTGVVVESGGFLDIGDQNVLLDMNEVRVVSGGDDDQVAFVTRYTEEEMENMPEVGDSWW